MPSPSKAALDKADHALELERCRRFPHHFIFESGLCLTKDEHDATHPVKPFPDIPYLRVLLDCLCVSGRLLRPDQAKYAAGAVNAGALEAMHATGLLLVEKSRQILATWTVIAYLLWRAKFLAHQLLLVQSKKEEDAANLVFNGEPFVGRMSFMESHLPKWAQTVQRWAYAHQYHKNGSHVWAIPEGGAIIRSNTPSVVFADEAAFQPEFDHSFTAAKPAVVGGGQYVAISSAEPGSFMQLAEATA